MSDYTYRKIIIDRDGVATGEKIINVPDEVVKQIRIKTIEEFQHKLKTNYTRYDIDCVLEDTNFYSYPLACHYLEDYIDEIAEQLKEQNK